MYPLNNIMHKPNIKTKQNRVVGKILKEIVKLESFIKCIPILITWLSVMFPYNFLSSMAMLLELLVIFYVALIYIA